MSNPFARIASAPASPHLQEVRQLRQTVMSRLDRLRLVNVGIDFAKPDEPLAVWMHRGHGGHRFTYLVTDGQVAKGDLKFNQRIVTGGTFTLEIFEECKQVNVVALRLRPGFDTAKILKLLGNVHTLRTELRRVSKAAGDDERTIEMVIKIVE